MFAYTPLLISSDIIYKTYFGYVVVRYTYTLSPEDLMSVKNSFCI